MKRSILLLTLLLATAAPLLALDTRNARKPANVIDDVIRMTQAGVSDEAIISYVVHFRHRFEVNADDIIALTNAHVSADVVKAVVDEAAARKDDDRTRAADAEPDDADPFFYPFWPYYYYDPWWYMPRYYTAFGKSLSRPKEAVNEATHNPGSRSVPSHFGGTRPRSR